MDETEAGVGHDPVLNEPGSRRDRRESLLKAFESFRDELDEHHDRKERVVKASRDVTAASKKIIFQLQRARDLNQYLEGPQSILVREHATRARTLLETIAPDLHGINRYRYAAQMQGLEELVEALALWSYVETQAVPSAGRLADGGPESPLAPALGLTAHDYLFGIMDLFGEMMRFATVLAARAGTLASRPGAERTILHDMHALAAAIEALPDVPARQFRYKVEVMHANIRKVEQLAYGLAIRGGEERPGSWMCNPITAEHEGEEEERGHLGWR